MSVKSIAFPEDTKLAQSVLLAFPLSLSAARRERNSMKRLRRINHLVAIGGAGLFSLATGCGTKDATGPGPGDLVFAKRMHTTVSGTDVNIDIAGGTNQVIDYLRYVPGGGVYVLSPAR